MADYPAEGAAELAKPCPWCGRFGLLLTWELAAKPIGSFSLAGVQMKVSAMHRAAVACPDCKVMQAGVLTGDVKVVDGAFVSGDFVSVAQPIRPGDRLDS